jgi:phosphoglycolate phosphatase
MAYTTAIFDLDGTILDTLADLASSVNFVLKSHEMPLCSLDHIRKALGYGMDYLIAHCVPAATPRSVEQHILQEFKKHYGLHCADTTAPYPGIEDLLNDLHKHNIRCAVVSNKGDFAVQELIAHYFPKYFDAVVGEKEGVRRKPAPDVVRAVMEKLGSSREECVYIGDSEVDIQTAKNAGTDCISVDWGFREHAYLVEQGAAHIVSSTSELLNAICA